MNWFVQNSLRARKKTQCTHNLFGICTEMGKKTKEKDVNRQCLHTFKTFLNAQTCDSLSSVFHNVIKLESSECSALSQQEGSALVCAWNVLYHFCKNLISFITIFMIRVPFVAGRLLMHMHSDTDRQTQCIVFVWNKGELVFLNPQPFQKVSFHH